MTTVEPPATAPRRTPFRALIVLTAAAVLLQGLWAGVFLEHDGRRDASSSWIDVHARGGELAIVLALLAAALGFARLRERRDLWGGAALLGVLLALESYLGGLIRDDGKDVLTAVHVPLAMAIMGLSGVLVSRAWRD